MRRGKIVLIVILAALALCFTGILIWGIRAGENFGQELRRSFSGKSSTYTQTIDLTDIRKLSLDYGSADLVISPGSGSEMVLTEYFSGEPKGENYGQVRRDEETGSVSVTRGKEYMSVSFFSFGSGLLRAEISIPETYEGEIAVKTGSGNVEMARLQTSRTEIEAGSGDIRLEALTGGNVSVSTGSGNIRAEECTAGLDLETGSGDLRLDQIHGSVHIETSSGDVELTEGTGSRSIKTSSGDLVMDSGGEDIQVETGSGDVTIRKLESQSFRLQTETGSGDLSGDVIRSLGINKEEETYQGIYGDSPGFQVNIQTGSGDIRLK